MDNLENQSVEQDSYKTGSTKPPKNRGGLVAGLLVTVILLAGVSSILGLMNIQLFHMLREEKEIPVSFEENMQTETKEASSGVEQDAPGTPELGVTVEDISELDRRYYHLPTGVLVTKVDAHGCAAKAGLAAGDIILSFNGVEVQTAEELEKVLDDCRAGNRAEVKFYRYQTKQMTEIVVVLEAEG